MPVLTASGDISLLLENDVASSMPWKDKVIHKSPIKSLQISSSLTTLSLALYWPIQIQQLYNKPPNWIVPVGESTDILLNHVFLSVRLFATDYGEDNSQQLGITANHHRFQNLWQWPMKDRNTLPCVERGKRISRPFGRPPCSPGIQWTRWANQSSCGGILGWRNAARFHYRTVNNYS